MLKCLLLSLGFLLSVNSVPLEIETESSIGQDIIEDVTDENTTEAIEDAVTEEPMNSQVVIDAEVPDELVEGSGEFQEGHSFVLEDDSEESNLAEMENDVEDDTVMSERKLEDLNTSSCSQRPSNFSHGSHSYWFPGETTKSDWLSARNTCRRHCMDLLSIETPAEHRAIADYIKQGDLPYIWTSGRLCNFHGCDRPDLQPISVAGWFWSGSGVRIAPTNSTPPFWGFQPWSHTGHKSQFYGYDVPQPDNAEEEINGSTEACLAVFNDIYDDGVAWHDAACYHRKMFLCEEVDDIPVKS